MSRDGSLPRLEVSLGNIYETYAILNGIIFPKKNESKAHARVWKNELRAAWYRACALTWVAIGQSLDEFRAMGQSWWRDGEIVLSWWRGGETGRMDRQLLIMSRTLASPPWRCWPGPGSTGVRSSRPKPGAPPRWVAGSLVTAHAYLQLLKIQKKVTAPRSRVLVLIDLENFFWNVVREIDTYLDANKAHKKVCEVIGYSNLQWNSTGRAKLPEYMKHKRTTSNGKEAADVLMAYDAGRLLSGAGGTYKGVLIVSDDHFAKRLQETLSKENVRARQVGTGQRVVRALREML